LDTFIEHGLVHREADENIINILRAAQCMKLPPSFRPFQLTYKPEEVLLLANWEYHPIEYQNNFTLQNVKKRLICNIFIQCI
jgi:hypothetical protein